MTESASEWSTDRAQVSREPWYRDSGLWIALLGTLSARLLFMLNWFTIWRDARWAGHMKYDVSVWQDFWRTAQEGKIPYVDFSREYPVFASVIYWMMSSFVDPNDDQNVYLVHFTVMAGIDLLNVGLFYQLAREVNPRWALAATLLFALNLTAVVLGPVRFESILVTTLLIGYQLHLRGKTLAATAVWSLGTGVKWYPMFLVAAQEVKIFFVDRKRSHIWRAGFVFVLVQVLLNGPFLVAAWLKNGNVDYWLETYKHHAHRQLSADTLLGMAEMWFGRISWEGYAAHVSLALILAAVFLRPSMTLDAKAVLIGIAFLIFNRIYSPQFNLWFYPFLFLWMLRLPPKHMAWPFVLFCLIDIANVAAYPFVFTDALIEMRRFGPMRAKNRGGFWTEVWSGTIVLRASLLFALALALLRERRVRVAEREAVIALGEAAGAE
jgi:hypothetical protein